METERLAQALRETADDIERDAEETFGARRTRERAWAKLIRQFLAQPAALASLATAAVEGDAAECACVAAYNVMDMGPFPSESANPEFERKYMQAALAAAFPALTAQVAALTAQCEGLTRELETLRKEREWQPMSTAPKETPILICTDHSSGNRVHCAAHTDQVHGKGIFGWAIDDRKHGPYALRGYMNVLGWRPLPPAIAAGNGEGV